MTTTDLPLPGTIGLTKVSGGVGKLIKLGQWLNGQGFENWEHAFVLGPNGKIIEAEPGGARIGSVNEYSDIYWCVNIAAQYNRVTLNNIWVGGQKYIGVPYSFLDYAALSAHRLHIPAPGLQSYIASTRHMICSQLADQMYNDQGAHLFAGTWPGYVTPLGIYNLDQRLRITRSVRGLGGSPPQAQPRSVEM